MMTFKGHVENARMPFHAYDIKLLNDHLLEPEHRSRTW